MSEALTAFPLCWPAGWPRAGYRREPKPMFKNNTFAKARDNLGRQLDLLKAREVILSTSVPLRIDGSPRGDFRECLPDPGVAVYFQLKGRAMAMATDAFHKVSDNLRRLSLAIEHLRLLERHGGAQMIERAFTGFAALPDPGKRKTWRDALAFEPGVEITTDLVEARYRDLAMLHHPDRGGSESLMAEINAARDEALRVLSPMGATA